MEVKLLERTGSIVRLHVQVSDTGIGIAQDKQALVFLPFAQADSSSTRRHGGMGLGLAICRSIIDSYGGTIWVEVNHDRGVTFFFRLSAARMDGIEQHPSRPGEKRD